MGNIPQQIHSGDLTDLFGRVLSEGKEVTIKVDGKEMKLTKATNLAWGDNDGGWIFEYEG